MNHPIYNDFTILMYKKNEMMNLIFRTKSEKKNTKINFSFNDKNYSL